MSAARTLALLSLAAGVVACGGSDKPSGPSTNNNQQVITRLTQLSTRMAETPAGGFVAFATAGLSLGVQPSTINVTTDLARRGPVAEGVSLSVAGAAKAMEAVAFRVILQNYPGFTGDFQMNGGVMWSADLNEFVIVMGTNAASSFGDVSGDDFAMGALFTVSPQASWIATTGTMNVTGGPSPTST